LEKVVVIELEKEKMAMAILEKVVRMQIPVAYLRFWSMLPLP